MIGHKPREGVGPVFVPAAVLFVALLIWSLGCQPAEALEDCVEYSTICVPVYVVRWLPPAPAGPVETQIGPVDLVRGLIVEFFPSWAVEDALAVVGCETGYTYDPDEWNPSSGASGLFQHMPRYWSERSTKAGWAGASIFDPEANVAVAAWLWGQTGTWQHWTCKP